MNIHLFIDDVKLSNACLKNYRSLTQWHRDIIIWVSVFIVSTITANYVNIQFGTSQSNLQHAHTL